MSQDIVGTATQEGNVQLLDELLAYPPAITLIGDTHTNATMDGFPSLAGVAVGDIVTGSGIPTSPPSFVVALDDNAHTVTLNQATTSTVTDTPITFTPNPSPLPATLHLFKEAFSPSPASVEADFLAEECDFSGYSAATLSFGLAGLDANGNGVSFASRVEYQNSTGVVGNSVGGAWLSFLTVPGMSPVNKSIRYYKFPAPIPMSVALATLGAVVVLNTPSLNGKVIVDN